VDWTHRPPNANSQWIVAPEGGRPVGSPLRRSAVMRWIVARHAAAPPDDNPASRPAVAGVRPSPLRVVLSRQLDLPPGAQLFDQSTVGPLLWPTASAEPASAAALSPVESTHGDSKPCERRLR